MINRAVSARSAIAASSASRPRKLVSRSGRLPVTVPAVRGAAKSEARPSIVSWYSRSGRGTSRRRCVPRSSSAGAGRQLVGDEGRGGPGQDDLAAVAGRRDPGRAADVEAPVVVARQVRLARVEAHPDAQAALDGPGLLAERALRRDRRGHGSAGLGEGGEQRVTLGPDGDAAAVLDGTTDDGQVLGVDLVPGRAERPDVAHGAFDVGAQERDGPGG